MIRRCYYVGEYAPDVLVFAGVPAAVHVDVVVVADVPAAVPVAVVVVVPVAVPAAGRLVVSAERPGSPRGGRGRSFMKHGGCIMVSKSRRERLLRWSGRSSWRRRRRYNGTIGRGMNIGVLNGEINHLKRRVDTVNADPCCAIGERSAFDDVEAAAGTI